ncbi:MAG: hypothetical protein E6G67_05180, partial [Actinobacteria bacterium]
MPTCARRRSRRRTSRSPTSRSRRSRRLRSASTRRDWLRRATWRQSGRRRAAGRRAIGVRKGVGRPICSSGASGSPFRSNIPAMATFSVEFLGCKVSHADAHELRERLLADGHMESADRAEVAVLNTCCVTHEAVRKSRQAARRAARRAARVYVTGCAANLASDAFAGLPENVRVVRLPSERTPAFVAGDVGAIACVQADARLERVRAFVKVQDGCSFSC